MIASLSGQVLASSLSGAVIGVGGVGFAVSTTPGTAARLRVGEPAELFTSLVVREDSLTMFGFAEADERDAFELLQSVSGVGPKLALAMLAVYPPATLAQAIESEDETALTRIPGVGKKSAARLILELKGKLAAPPAASQSLPGADAASGPMSPGIVEALVGLGWQAKQAEAAVAQAAAEAEPGEGGQVPSDSQLLRRALQLLGRGRS